MTMRILRTASAIAALSIGLAGLSVAVNAQQPPPAASSARPPAPSIGVVDLQGVYRSSQAAKDIKDQIEKQTSTFQGEFQKRDSDLRTAEQTLQQQRSTMSSDAFAEKRMTLETQATDLQHEFENRKRQIDDAVNDAQNEVVQAELDIIEQIRQERGLNLVLRREGVIKLTPELDLTAEVQQRLDKKLPHVNVKLVATTAPAKH